MGWCACSKPRASRTTHKPQRTSSLVPLFTSIGSGSIFHERWILSCRSSSRCSLGFRKRRCTSAARRERRPGTASSVI
eukprot:168377-Pyramimonas_sp.AAC.1